MSEMKKGKAKLTRNDSVLKIKERHFKLKGDDTTFIAMTTRFKKKTPTVKHTVEYWVGYYTPERQQRGLGFFYKKKDIPKKYEEAFKGLSVKPTKRRK
jgi:hypothetical protein